MVRDFSLEQWWREKEWFSNQHWKQKCRVKLSDPIFTVSNEFNSEIWTDVTNRKHSSPISRCWSFWNVDNVSKVNDGSLQHFELVMMVVTEEDRFSRLSTFITFAFALCGVKKGCFPKAPASIPYTQEECLLDTFRSVTHVKISERSTEVSEGKSRIHTKSLKELIAVTEMGNLKDSPWRERVFNLGMSFHSTLHSTHTLQRKTRRRFLGQCIFFLILIILHFLEAESIFIHNQIC